MISPDGWDRVVGLALFLAAGAVLILMFLGVIA